MIIGLLIEIIFNIWLSPEQVSERIPDKPNVLFIAIDDINDWVEFMGENSASITPNLNSLANESTAFLNAYCSAPVCGPSRTSLLYGIFPHKSGSYGHHAIYDPENIPELAERETLPALFRREGYYTAGAGKIFHYNSKDGFETYFDADDPKPDPDHSDTFTPTESALRFGPVKPEDETAMCDYQITEWAIEQLNTDFKKPFFIGVGYKKPHLPWIAKQANFEKFNLDSIKLSHILENELEDIPNGMGQEFAHSLFGFYKMEDESDHEFVQKHPMLWKKLIRAYMASINHTDEMIGKLIKGFQESPYHENTIIVLWGDHGWHLGEKEHWRKMTLWRKGTRTPFMIYDPRITKKGSRVKHPVSLQDIYPTLVELCELNTEQELDGRSLVPLLRDKQHSWDYPVLISHGPGNFAVCSGNWRYIQYYDGGKELYDIEVDPREHINRANNPDSYRIIQKLQAHIPKEYKHTLGPRFNVFYE